jgi:putative transposase
MCRVLEVSTSGYYDWLRRGPSKREREDARLLDEIRRSHEESKRTYGSPRVHQDLRENGENVGRKRVARLMKAEGLQGVTRRPSTRTTKRDRDARRAPDLVERQFEADGPNKLWVADFTYVHTWAGFLYLAIVLDVWSRRIVGWSMSASQRTEGLVVAALDMALARRQALGVIHHSDQGSQYTSLIFGQRCREAGVTLSMGSVGDCFDNAMAESFFATLETELLDRSVFRTREEARRAIFAFIEGWYNPRRRHSSIGYVSPVEFERTHTPR